MTLDLDHTQNPDAKNIESAFAGFVPRSPSENVLNRVRTMAHNEVSPRANWVLSLASFFTVKRVVLATTTFAVIGLALVNLTSLVPEYLNTGDLAATINGNKTNTAILTPKIQSSPEMLNWAQTQLDHGLELFRDQKFDESQGVFASIATQVPDFPKRREVYLYWIESLKKMGEYRAAETKQRELEMERP